MAATAGTVHKGNESYLSQTPKDYVVQYYESIHSDYENFLSGDKNALKNLVDLNITLFDKIGALEIEARSLAHQIKPLLTRAAESECEINFLKHENIDLKHKIALLEDATKLMYLRVEGLSEFPNETLPTRIATVLSGTGIMCNVQDLDFVRRIGAYKEGFTRPVLVKFIKESKRNAILYNRNVLNMNKTSNFIWINDDTSDETRRNRKTARDVAALAKLSGNENVKIHGDGIIVNGTKFKHTDMDLLPPEISVDKAKTRESEDDIYFQGEHSPLSNFFPTRFTDDSGFIFHNAEQAYQSKKAKFHGKLLLADKILCTRNPYRIKQLSKDIPNNKEWIGKEQDVMKSILLNKFQQNNDLASILMNTGDKHLHEATSDLKWATGAELASKALMNSDWYGQDILGQLLESVRLELKAKHQHQHPDIGSADLLPGNQLTDGDRDDLSPMPDSDMHDQFLLNEALPRPSVSQATALQHSFSRQEAHPTITSTPARNSQPTFASPTIPTPSTGAIPKTKPNLHNTSQKLGTTKNHNTEGSLHTSTSPTTAPPPRPPPPRKLPPRSARAKLAATRAASAYPLRGSQVINC